MDVLAGGDGGAGDGGPERVPRRLRIRERRAEEGGVGTGESAGVGNGIVGDCAKARQEWLEKHYRLSLTRR